MAILEESLDAVLANADQSMVNALSGGFRVAQTQLAIAKALTDPKTASAALESAQVVALAILVREELYPSQFDAIYRPFATVLPGPGYEPPPSADSQVAAFIAALPTLTGPAEVEAATIAKALSERPKAGTAPPGQLAEVLRSAGFDPAANYSAAWKLVLGAAPQTGRAEEFRAAQLAAEQAAPHDGLGIVGFAGVAAGALFMREAVPIEKVLLLFEPFSSAFPYESLR